MQGIDWLIAWKTVIVGAVFVLFFVAERLIPTATQHSLTQVAKNIGLAAFNFLASPFIVIPITAFAAGYAPNWRPEWWTGNFGLVIDLLILDFWIYWWHRANHTLPALWRWHEVHHLDETLDASTAVRFHVGEVLLSSLVRAAVIWFLAIPLTSVIVFEVIVTAAAIFHHSNVRLPYRFEHALSYILVTPSIHWVHHHAIRRDTDSNYSTVLAVWDRLFGSSSATQRTPAMPIGVEGQRDVNLPELLIRPITKMRR